MRRNRLCVLGLFVALALVQMPIRAPLAGSPRIDGRSGLDMLDGENDHVGIEDISVTDRGNGQVGISFDYRIWCNINPSQIDQLFLSRDGQIIDTIYDGIPGRAPGRSGSHRGVYTYDEDQGSEFSVVMTAARGASDGRRAYANGQGHESRFVTVRPDQRHPGEDDRRCRSESHGREREWQGGAQHRFYRVNFCNMSPCPVEVYIDGRFQCTIFAGRWSSLSLSEGVHLLSSVSCIGRGGPIRFGVSCDMDPSHCMYVY
jgi:hypothetical protein